MGIKERKEREKEQRKQLILNAAQKLFFTKGINSTTMDDIAVEAELAKGTLYIYFKSKEDIQYEVSLRGAELLNRKLRRLVDENSSGLENLLIMGWAFIEFSKDEKDFFNLFLYFQNLDIEGLGISKEKIKDYFLHFSPFRLLIDLVEKGIKDGSLRNDLPVIDTATTMWSNIMGLLIVQQFNREIYEIFSVNSEKILQTNFEILLNGVSNKEKDHRAKLKS